MPQFRLSRRAVLRGAGSVAIALPWLEIMRPERSAHAAAAPAKRLINVFTPGGTVIDRWRPIGGETTFVLNEIMKPLESVREQLVVLDGLDLKSKSGEQDQAGLIAWLTGNAQDGNGGYALGPSLDQVLRPLLSHGPIPSLELAVRWGTGKSRGLPHPINIASYADTPTLDPIVPRTDPVKVWKELFGTDHAESTDQAWERSILDGVQRRYSTLAKRLGAEDRQRLEQHLDRIRALEQEVTLMACTGPEQVDTSDYNPEAGKLSDDIGLPHDGQTDAAIPKVGKLMMDMLVTALSCDLTSVATLMWSDTEAKHTFPWLGLNETQAFYRSDGGYQEDECATIFTWYAQQHAYLIESLARAPSQSGSLLDESLVFFGSNLSHPATHSNVDMPFLLAGHGGGLKTGRYLNFNHASHNDLLVSLCNLCGDDRQTFGNPQYCSGPLAGLT